MSHNCLIANTALSVVFKCCVATSSMQRRKYSTTRQSAVGNQTRKGHRTQSKWSEKIHFVVKPWAGAKCQILYLFLRLCLASQKAVIQNNVAEDVYPVSSSPLIVPDITYKAHYWQCNNTKFNIFRFSTCLIYQHRTETVKLQYLLGSVVIFNLLFSKFVDMISLHAKQVQSQSVDITRVQNKTHHKLWKKIEQKV